MKRQQTPAGRSGSNNSATAPAPAATKGATPPPPADAAFEKRLAVMLQGVPPLIRLPKPGTRCQFTSMSRGAMFECVAPSARNEFRPAVKAIYRKSRRGAQRGIWLIPSRNLFAHLLSLEANACEEFLATSKARKAANEGAEEPAEPQPVGSEVES